MTTYTFSPIDDGTIATLATGINDAGQIVGEYEAVSYTHLTLPTICSV